MLQKLAKKNNHSEFLINITTVSVMNEKTFPFFPNFHETQFHKKIIAVFSTQAFAKSYCFKGEIHSIYIFLYFVLIGLEQDFIILFTKMNFFSLPRLTFQHHLHKVHMDFYLLRFTYVNDVNVGRNILMNSQLKRNFFVSSDKKK